MPADSFEIVYVFDPASVCSNHKHTCDGSYWEWLFGMLEGTGTTFLYRVNLSGRAFYRSDRMARFDHATVDRSNPKAQYWHGIADMLDACDPLAEAAGAARRHGIPIWAWWNWNEWQNVRLGYLDLVDREWYDQPRRYWCTRDGSRFYCGVPDWGSPVVQERLVALAAETLAYGVDGLYLSTRSHSWWACWPTADWDKHLEPFGFNDSVVEAYRHRHGVDIRYEDYDEDQWLRIKGEQFSALLARVGAMAHGAGRNAARKFIVGIQPDRTSLMVDYERSDVMHPAGPNLHLYKDWERWAAEGSVDGICAEEACHLNLKIDGGDIRPFQETLPTGFPLYTWADTSAYHDRGGGPFNIVNWDRVSVRQMLEQIEVARCGGAAGVLLHSIEMFTSWDSAGASIGGYGVVPRTEYFDALRELHARK